MTDKIRKRLGPVSVVATIAVLGLLAAFIALAALPDIASAQPDPMARRIRRRLRVVMARRRHRLRVVMARRIRHRLRVSPLGKLAARRKPT